MTAIDYSEDEYDMLREIFNLALGQAGANLAELLRSFVDLSVPEIQIVAAESMLEVLLADETLSEQKHLSAVRQTFYRADQVDGEAIVLFANAPQTLAKVLGLSQTVSPAQELEFLLELSNIVVGACLNGISLQLFDQEMSFQPPTILAEKTDLRRLTYDVFPRRMLQWNQSLLVRIRFRMEKESFLSHLLILMSEKSIKAVGESLRRLLGQM